MHLTLKNTYILLAPEGIIFSSYCSVENMGGNMCSFFCFLTVSIRKLIVCWFTVKQPFCSCFWKRNRDFSVMLTDWDSFSTERDSRFSFIIHWLSICWGHFKSPSFIHASHLPNHLWFNIHHGNTLKNMLHTTLGTLTLCYEGKYVILPLSYTFI